MNFLKRLFSLGMWSPSDGFIRYFIEARLKIPLGLQPETMWFNAYASTESEAKKIAKVLKSKYHFDHVEYHECEPKVLLRGCVWDLDDLFHCDTHGLTRNVRYGDRDQLICRDCSSDVVRASSLSEKEVSKRVSELAKAAA